jgi:hypothetical protein
MNLVAVWGFPSQRREAPVKQPGMGSMVMGETLGWRVERNDLYEVMQLGRRYWAWRGVRTVRRVRLMPTVGKYRKWLRPWVEARRETRRMLKGRVMGAEVVR